MTLHLTVNRTSVRCGGAVGWVGITGLLGLDGHGKRGRSLRGVGGKEVKNKGWDDAGDASGGIIRCVTANPERATDALL
jgi:hypothetical protein